MFNYVWVNTEKLLFKGFLIYSVMIVKPRLRSPANVERAVNVGLGPLENLREFLPIIDLGEMHFFNRRARDYHSVVGVFFNIVADKGV